MTSKAVQDFIEVQEQTFKEYQKETKKQLLAYGIFVIVLFVVCIFFAVQAINANNAIDGILKGHQKQLYKLNDSYQNQIDCLQETYKFQDDECI